MYKSGDRQKEFMPGPATNSHYRQIMRSGSGGLDRQLLIAKICIIAASIVGDLSPIQALKGLNLLLIPCFKLMYPI